MSDGARPRGDQSEGTLHQRDHLCEALTENAVSPQIITNFNFFLFLNVIHNVDRVPVPVIPIQGRTLHQCKKGGSIRMFAAPYV